MDDAGKFNEAEDALSRREFTVAAAAAGAAVAAVAGEAEAAGPREVVEKDVVIKTAAGDCDAALYYPAGKGSWPGVLIAADALGLRPAFREMGKALAAEGYTVLVPNPFYRAAKSPVFRADFSFSNAEDRAKIFPMMAALTPEVVEADLAAWLDFLDAQPQTNKKKKLGVQGYCMGGPTTVRAAALRANRVGAACSFHGGGLTTDKPDSPHLLIPKSKAAFYFGVADNDDKQQPESKDILKKTLSEAKRPGIVTVYTGAQHGWCMSDFPVYNKPAADIAWANMLAMYKQNIA